jgi:hypothetical protein
MQGIAAVRGRMLHKEKKWNQAVAGGPRSEIEAN